MEFNYCAESMEFTVDCYLRFYSFTKNGFLRLHLGFPGDTFNTFGVFYVDGSPECDEYYFDLLTANNIPADVPVFNKLRVSFILEGSGSHFLDSDVANRFHAVVSSFEILDLY